MLQLESQPLSQLWSQPKPPLQLESQSESQLPPKKPSQESLQDPPHLSSQSSLQSESHESLQEPSQLSVHECSCRRSRAPSAPPVIADSFDERDEVLLSEGSPQPSTAESVIARWTSIVNRGPCIDLSNA